MVTADPREAAGSHGQAADSRKVAKPVSERESLEHEHEIACRRGGTRCKLESPGCSLEQSSTSSIYSPSLLQLGDVYGTSLRIPPCLAVCWSPLHFYLLYANAAF